MLLTGDVTMVTCRLSCLSLEVKYQVNLISDDNCRILVYFSLIWYLYMFFFKKRVNTLYISIYRSWSIIKQDGKPSKIKAVLLQLDFELRYKIRHKSVAVKNNTQEMLLQKSGGEMDLALIERQKQLRLLIIFWLKREIMLMGFSFCPSFLLFKFFTGIFTE